MNIQTENINKLFDTAEKAKSIQDYEVANRIFAVLATVALAENSGLHFEYEQANGGLIQSLANPDTDGYYDLPAVADANGNYLCIPLPLVSQSFMDDFIKKGAIYQERQEHNREYSDLEGAELESLGLSIRQQFESLMDAEILERSVAVVLRCTESDDNTADEEDEMIQYLGPSTLANLNVVDPEKARVPVQEMVALKGL